MPATAAAAVATLVASLMGGVALSATTAEPAAAVAAECSIATNGSFEEPNIQDPENPGPGDAYVNGYNAWRTGQGTISGWRTVAGTIDQLRYYNNASDGEQSIDLWGTAPATIEQTFTGLVPGAEYTFSIDYSGIDTAASATVLLSQDGPFTQLATLSPSGESVSNGSGNLPETKLYTVQWSTYTNTFIATGTSATVQLQNQVEPAASNTGLFIDNFTFSGAGACQDFGDAPDSYGTTYASEGARHVVADYNALTSTASVMLGATIDLEEDGQPGAANDADGDDGLAASPTITSGKPSSVSVSTTNNSSQDVTLAGWMDLNGDGMFQNGERSTIVVPAGSGTASYTLNFPVGTVTADTFSRFRVFGAVVDDPQPTGNAAGGEVEDYSVTAVPQAFTCDANGYLFQNPEPGVNLVQSVDLVTGEYRTIFTTPTPLNGVGYNTADNFFYGLTTGTNVLNRIGADGTVKDLGAVPGLPAGSYIVGDFDSAGQYWVLQGNVQAHQIDLAPGSPMFGTVVRTVPMTMPAGITSMNPDWGYIDGGFYATGAYPDGDNVLLRFDPVTGNQTLVALLTGPDGSTMSGLMTGAVYVDAAGYLYGSNNADGNIYRIDTTTGATILLAAGPAAGGNDGARCATASIPTLTVTKSVQGRQAPADQFTVGIVDSEGTVQAEATTTGTATTASTVDQPVSQGATYTITDTMAAGSAGAINAYTTGIQCLNTGTGAAVPTQGTGPWTLTIPAAADFACNVTNAAVPVGVELVKTADAAAQENIEAGQVITYSFRFTNTGDVPLSDIRIDETGFTGTGPRPVVTCPVTAVDPDESVTCTAAYTVTQADADAGSITNEATGTGTPPAGFPVPPVSTASKVTVPNNPAPGISVVKSADAAALEDITVGQDVRYSFLVKNTGNVTLADVSVTEGEFTGTGELSAVTCPAGAGSLAPGAEMLCTADYTITQADVDAGSVTNTATATGTSPGGTTPPVSTPSTVTVPGNPAPSLAVVKTASTDQATAAGQEITYSFLLTNTGNVTLTDATVVEGEFTGTGNLTAVTCPDTAASLVPGASVTCTANYNTTAADQQAGTIKNTATGSATTFGGGTLTSGPSTAEITTTPALTPEGPAVGEPAAPAKETLANTGFTTGVLALAALLIMLLGAGTVAAAKIRNGKNAC